MNRIRAILDSSRSAYIIVHVLDSNTYAMIYRKTMGTKSFSHGLGKSMVVGGCNHSKNKNKNFKVVSFFTWSVKYILFFPLSCLHHLRLSKPKLFHVVGNFCLFMYLFCIPTYFVLHSKVHIIHSPKVAMIIAYTIFSFLNFHLCC